MSPENEAPVREVEARGRATQRTQAGRQNSTAHRERSAFGTRVNVRVRPLVLVLPRAVWTLPRQRRGARS